MTWVTRVQYHFTIWTLHYVTKCVYSLAGIEDMSTKKDSRTRLSIDLDAYPEVRDMLLDAMEATGASATKIAIAALRSRLPEVVRSIQTETSQKTEEFLKKYRPEKTKEVIQSLGTAFAAAVRIEQDANGPLKPGVNSTEPGAGGHKATALKLGRQRVLKSKQTPLIGGRSGKNT